MATDTAPRTTADANARTTRGVLLVAGIIGALELAFAAAVAISTWYEMADMTPSEQADSWAGIGYYFAAAIAVPPAAAASAGVAAWVLRRRSAGLALAVVSLVVVGLELAFFLRGIVTFV